MQFSVFVEFNFGGHMCRKSSVPRYCEPVKLFCSGDSEILFTESEHSVHMAWVVSLRTQRPHGVGCVTEDTVSTWRGLCHWGHSVHMAWVVSLRTQCIHGVGYVTEDTVSTWCGLCHWGHSVHMTWVVSLRTQCPHDVGCVTDDTVSTWRGLRH